MSEYMFGAGNGKVPASAMRRIAKIAHHHGAVFVNHRLNGRDRFWFVAPNRGSIENRDVEKRVMRDLQAHGLLPDVLTGDRASGGRAKSSARSGFQRPRLDAFTTAYIETALSSTNDARGVPLEKNYSIGDIDMRTVKQMKEQCEYFKKKCRRLIETDESPEIKKYGRWALAGRDFWLTRQGRWLWENDVHGNGFSDGGWPMNGDALTKAAKEYGYYSFFVGENGSIYGSRG